METKCGRRSSRMKNGTVSVVAKINSNVSKKKNKKLSNAENKKKKKQNENSKKPIWGLNRNHPPK